MRIQVNGEVKDVPAGLALDSLLEHLSLPGQRVAIELNREVVRKVDWPATIIKDDDRIEVVHFVGGG
jgi:thiamine biosynthesis protein ThiS